MTKKKSNKLIRIVTIALIIVTAISIISVTASAETTTAVPENEYVYTDINNDGILDENDIKELQRYLVEEELITETKRSSLDANRDGNVDVHDATAYQRLINRP